MRRLDSDEWIVSINDVKRLYIAIWRQLVGWGLLGGCLSFFAIGLMKTEYKAEACFKEGLEISNSEGLLKELMMGINLPKPPQASSIMKSHQVLRPLVQKLGLQIRAVESEGIFKRFCETIRAEKELPLEQIDPFVFGDVEYEGDVFCHFDLLFSDADHYTIINREKKGAKDLRFTLKSVPKNIKIGTPYPFKVVHWAKAAEELRKKLKIEVDRTNSALIHIAYSDRDRELAARIVNGLMEQYQHYLTREYDHVAKEQLGYLEKKQAEIYEKMGQILDENTAYLKENGFISLGEESKSLLIPYQEMDRKMRAIEVELSRLEQIEKEGKSLAFIEEGLFASGLNQWAEKVSGLKQERDLIELGLSRMNGPHFCRKAVPSELEGIDLPSARSLILQYNEKLDAAQGAMRRLDELKREIQNPQFELASLSSILTDPVCQKILAEASAIEQRLKDKKHYSSKEAANGKEELDLQRKILSDHFEQMHKVEQLNAELIREKMIDLQNLSLNCINQQISVFREQKDDAIIERRSALLLEKGILEKKMGEIRISLAKILPEKWRFEKWLELKTGIVTKVMETVTDVVESKTISNHLHHVESKPLDAAIVPLVPKRPHLYKLTLLGAFVGSFLFFLVSFFRQMMSGFPLTLEKVKALGWPAIGREPFEIELLRKISLFAKGSKVVGLLTGIGPDYSSALCENIARLGTKGILVRCDFLSEEKSLGWLQLWKGEIGELPIMKGVGFDSVASGGFSLFGAEIIQSEIFRKNLDELKKNYDWVVLLFRSPLSSAESMAALHYCDKAVVTLSKEQTEELTPFVDWAYHDSCCRLTFVARA